jgi:hypothetical protein
MATEARLADWARGVIYCCAHRQKAAIDESGKSLLGQ